MKLTDAQRSRLVRASELAAALGLELRGVLGGSGVDPQDANGMTTAVIHAEGALRAIHRLLSSEKANEDSGG